MADQQKRDVESKKVFVDYSTNIVTCLRGFLVSSSDLKNGSSIEAIGKPAFTIKVVSLMLPDISNGKIK